MEHSIKHAQARFKKIIKGQIRKNLRDYVAHGKMPIPKGKEIFSIPAPSIKIPQFRFKEMDQEEGIGSGQGSLGDAPEDGEQKDQGDLAGSGEGNKEEELDVSFEELANLLGEELELPKIEPKGKQLLEIEHEKYNTLAKSGPNSLRHFKSSYFKALKRELSSGTFDLDNPSVVPEKPDLYYRTPKVNLEQKMSAVVIYMMDVSGSMGMNKKKLCVQNLFGLIYGYTLSIRD